MKGSIMTGIFLCCMLVFHSCKKDESASYGLGGRVVDGDSGEGLSGVEVLIEKQVIQNGVFGQTWSNASTATTASDGAYTCDWPRENFAALRVTPEKQSYVGGVKNLDVDAFKNAEDYSLSKDLVMYKEGFITVNLRNGGQATAQDRLAFTFLNANFDCNCCSNFWRVFDGASVDTTFTCRIYGNRWLKYQINTTIGFADSIAVDSVYCPAFATTAVQIDY
ncbi:MAG: hypothetical protein ACK478_08820 [Flavobacteriales bacterium]|jgi:hypothetical protein